jgi:hypothetical protein
MLKLELTKPYKAKAIHLKGSSKPLRDRIVFIAGNFLVVAQDMNDTAPTWYNVDQVVKLEGVEQIPEQRSAQQIRFFT